MEQKEKIEKPEWVEVVETLPEIIRQQVGTTCAGVISSLVQLYYFNDYLFECIIEESKKIVKDYFEELNDRNNANI